MDDLCGPRDYAIHRRNPHQTSHNTLRVSPRNIRCRVRNMSVGGQLSVLVPKRELRE
jgi:hypothetical protein